MLSADTAAVTAIELFSELLAELDGPFAPDAFYGRLCDAICRLTDMERGLICMYDADLRRVRAVGSHEVSLGLFDGVQISLSDAPVAARALTQDRVVEVLGNPEAVAPRFVEHVRGRRLTCVPMAANGRWVGVVLTDRPAETAALTEAERDLLWMLGKTAALATVARVATAQAERARELSSRIDMARDVHDEVIQRLFGVSLALDGAGALGAPDRERCATEVREALGQLRAALQRPLGREARPTRTTLVQEISRLSAQHPGSGIALAPGRVMVPAALEALSQSVLAEVIRNAHKHADPTRVTISLRHEGDAFVMEVVNDGVRERDGEGRVRGAGMGLRLAGFEALGHGGVLEFGPRDGGRWRTRLLVPDEAGR